mmetsp:Transcript_122497/g.305933  ORF Transcript_122497/g.305933 Transcript_122497/m.305933 type:complete len:413 (+) Transcript_122497:118-1356(+)|eukprot:CAMPEP_0115234816 /NCGR_PEP_ID=MMETSP0270-20121206/34987_1 /TAXON_ID=71861 /ORGANISM="Scrippsiella trochoidea, Strain CCMP3099" /LENGTH=412 /DNA_ID=CAMNT_0002649573 /DNA_START=91 /DNA_END=1329 /DNA_ORIENTATION=-
MALMLSGESEHLTFAPLSHGQTLSICQHLEALIRDLQGQNADLRRDLTQADANIAALRKGLGMTDASVQGLQEGCNGMGNAIDGLKKELGRTNNKVNKLMANLEGTNDHAANTRETLKVTGTNLQTLRQDVGGLSDRVNAIQLNIETNLANSTDGLWQELRQAQVVIKTLQGENQKQSSTIQEQREGLRGANSNLQSLNDNLTKTNAYAGSLDKRLQEAVASLKSTRSELSDTITLASHIGEDHKHTKGQLSNSMEALKKLGSHVKRLQEGQDANSTKLSNAAELLQRTSSGLSQTKELLERTSAQVRSLSDAHDMMSTTTSSLQVHLENTSAGLRDVKDNLKKTNSLVLPNLQLDAQRPWSNTGTQKSPMSARTPKKVSTPSTPLPFNLTDQGNLLGTAHDLHSLMNSTSK